MSSSDPVITQLPTGHACHYYAVLDSTSTHAKTKITHPPRHPLWILAGRQSAGYGRRGNIWLHRAGNFAGTLVMPWRKSDKAPELVSFAAALAIKSSLQSLGIVADSIKLKWPNDVFLAGRKVCGILPELVENEGQISALLLGIGINLLAVSQKDGLVAASLSEIDQLEVPTPRQLLPVLDEHLKHWLETYHADGFAPVQAAWLEQAMGVGEMAVIKTPLRQFTARIITLAMDGSLEVETEAGEREYISAGEVFFGGTPSTDVGVSDA